MSVILVMGALVFIGTVVQRSVGLGFGLVAAPVLAIVWPEIVPAAILLMTTPLTLFMFLRDRQDVNLRELPALIGGKALGTGVGVLLLAFVTPASLALLVGAIVVIAVALSLGSFRLPSGSRWLACAGVASGVMGTTAATGGPPLAIAYQGVRGPQLRGTLAVVFLVGNAMSLFGLAAVGRLTTLHLGVAAGMMPLLGAGVWAGTRLAPRLDGGRLRHAVLGVAGISGLVACLRGLMSLG